MPAAHCKAFYSLLNLALSQDVRELMAPAAGFARAINDSLLVTSRTKPERQLFPPHDCTWRGGGFGIPGHATLSPDKLLAFFTPVRLQGAGLTPRTPCMTSPNPL